MPATGEWRHCGLLQQPGHNLCIRPLRARCCRYKPEHPEMAAKLKEMNGYLREVMAAIAEDTLLVVMGDHGE